MSAFGDLDETISSLSFPVLQDSDLERVAQVITQLFDPNTSSNPELAKYLQQQLQQIQSSNEAWGLIPGLSTHPDANVRFFSAHTAQIKISRDWSTLPHDLQPGLLSLLLETLTTALSPSNPSSYQAGNGIVIRKLFGCLASLLLRLPFHLFPNPLITVLHSINAASSLASTGIDEAIMGHKMRLWGLEWLSICVEELGRAGISEQKKSALRRHLDLDIGGVMDALMSSLSSQGSDEERVKEAEAGCKCAESWIDYGLGGDDLTKILPLLYDLLPLTAASSALVQVLSESVFRYGKGTKILTEPLIAWCIGPNGQLVGASDFEPTDEALGFAKLLAALVEHSSEWLVSHIQTPEVQAFLGLVLRITNWQGMAGIDENISELTLAIYPLLQEALMDSEAFQNPHETSPGWIVAKSFFRELVQVIRRKVQWPMDEHDKEDAEAFGVWRRDAGEVIVGAFYVLRDEMLKTLTDGLVEQIQIGASWQVIEASLHCIRYTAEAVPLGENISLPVVFGTLVLSRLSERQLVGAGEERLRLTMVYVIQSYEEWFKYHPDHLLPVLSYLVSSLTTTPLISRCAADALKALCDMSRKKLVEHIGAFSDLHGKIGDLGSEEQAKVIQGITSVIQALSPVEAIDPVQGIVTPIVLRLTGAINASQTDPIAIQPMLLQTLTSLTACFKGLSPSDDIFDLADEEETASEQEDAVRSARNDPRMSALRGATEAAIQGVVRVWNGDGEIADAISSFVKHSTLSETLISLSPLPLLTLVSSAAERSPSALWIAMAATLVLRINSPPSPLTKKRDLTLTERAEHEAEEMERWNVVGDAASRMVVVAGAVLSGPTELRDNPDVVEAWFKFCSALSTRFPGVLLRLPAQMVEAYISIGILGLAAQERFSLKTATEFFIALLANTRFPSPLEPLADSLIKHFGPQILRSLILSAGSEGPRSVIPNLAELLASFVQRVKLDTFMGWLDVVLAEDGFPDARATPAAKARLKEVVMRSRTAKKMREALHEFALVARGLDNTTYGNATAASI